MSELHLFRDKEKKHETYLKFKYNQLNAERIPFILIDIH